MKLLQIINCAYRATAEEQDDTVVWITHAMKDAGATIDVLLRGNAANYVVANQNAGGLTLGDWRQSQPPQLARDITMFLDKGMTVFVVDEDVVDRGIDDDEIIVGIQQISMGQIGQIVDRYDLVWQW